jgi:hypothetical protein
LLWHIDIQYRYPGVGDELPPYWWTNNYSWVQAESDVPESDAIGAVQAWSYAYCSSVVVRELYRVWNESGTYNVVTVDQRQGLYGSSGSFFAQYLWYCLLRGLDSAGRMVAYKRLRGGWDERYISGGRLKAATVSYVNGWIASPLSLYPYTSHSGVAVATWLLDPALRSWQKRHGSKRAARPVIAMP